MLLVAMNIGNAKSTFKKKFLAGEFGAYKINAARTKSAAKVRRKKKKKHEA